MWIDKLLFGEVKSTIPEKCKKCIHHLPCVAKDCNQICTECNVERKQLCFVTFGSQTREHCPEFRQDEEIFRDCYSCAEKDFCSIHSDFFHNSTPLEYETFMEIDKSKCPQYVDLCCADCATKELMIPCEACKKGRRNA